MTASSARRPQVYLPDPLRLSLLALILLALGGCSSTSSVSDDEDGTTNAHSSIFPFRIHSDGQQCQARWHKAPPLKPDVWSRVRQRYQIPSDPRNPRIITERNWLVKNQAYLNRVSDRSSRYIYHVANKLEERQMPGELALLPIVESAYNPFALSRSQASGLWQFIPSTAKFLKMDMNWWYDARRDIPTSTDTALDYLAFLRDHYNGDWLKALAAYNGGWGTVDRAIEKNRVRGLPTDYWSLELPAETMAYVPKFLALAQVSKTPEQYGIHWAYIPDLPYFSEVRFAGQMDVALAADLAGISSDELHRLNPGISRWATPPGGPYRLLVPVDQANDFQERIANLHASQLMPQSGYEQNRINSLNPLVAEMEQKAAARKAAAPPPGARTYTVKAGDTVWSVAKKSGTSMETLRKLNKMSANDSLKLGQKLVLPGGSSKAATTQASAAKTGTTKSSNTSNSKKTAYTVQRGDTLMAIARKHQIDVNDLARWNSLNKNTATLKPGQILTLYLAPSGSSKR